MSPQAGHSRARSLAAVARGRGAAAAELVGAIPVDELQRASGERKQAVVQPAVQGAQPLPQHALRRLGIGAVLEGVAGALAQGAQIQAAQRRRTETGKFLMPGQLRSGRVARNQQQCLLEHEAQALGVGLARGEHAADIGLGRGEGHHKESPARGMFAAYPPYAFLRRRIRLEVSQRPPPIFCTSP